MSQLQPYVLSLVAGIGVGALYAGLSVKSPAPPIIALLGLLGMITGEAGVQWLRGHKNFMQVCLHEKTFAIGSARQVTKDDAAL
ncbi:DUF1427 family protein [Paracoccus limosus]|jgi:XapX domain-containing protein|uniref:DUF1427 family protein n=1 Tax=Paracoccus limosus TaxID=913252 RepID=A0A844H471_9RHOB|nr:DUF1427 family protein [Paracoccus limosus]MTH34343.1 DUF1427 family protein [Paracoccus limosus]